MFVTIFIFIVALAILLKGSSLFVDSAIKLARHFKVSEFIIGLTLVSIGTSLPELANAIMASLTNNAAIMLGNITGANIINLCLNLGIISIFTVIAINKDMLKREVIFLILGPALLFIFATNGEISSLEGIILLLIYGVYIIELLEIRKKLNLFVSTAETELKHIEKEELLSEKPKENIYLNLLIFIGSGFLIYLGARYLIESASKIALGINIPASIIGFFAIALGTTLPEMMVSITAAQKKNSQILMGNVVGSNIVNIFMILGIGAIIKPFSVQITDMQFILPFLIFVTAVFVFFMYKNNDLKRFEGIILLLLYILFVLFLAWKMFGLF